MYSYANYDREYFKQYYEAFNKAPPVYTEIEPYEIKANLHIPGYRTNYLNHPVFIIPEVREGEIFLPITHSELLPNILPGRYYISNMGRVYDVYRQKFLYGTSNGRGYLNVKISYLTESGYYVNYKTIYIHQLVCFYFKYFSGCYPTYQVNHRDLNKNNNTVNNLEWSDCSANSKHCAKSYEMLGIKTRHSILTEDQVRQICIAFKQGYGLRDTARLVLPEFDIKKAESLVESIRYKTTWTHISREYDLPDCTPATRRYLTDQQIHSICKCLVAGCTDIQTAQISNCTTSQVVSVKYDGIAPEIRHQYGL